MPLYLPLHINDKITDTTDWYGKREAAITSALAILLMVWHHLFGFSDYLSEGVSWKPLFSIAGVSIERMIAAFGKICVSLFAFNSGYIAWKLRDQYKSPKINAKRALTFLLSYWIVLGIFMVFGLVTGSQLPNTNQFLFNLIGLGTDPAYSYINVSFAWYVTYYLSFLFLCPILLFIFSGNKYTDITTLIILVILPIPTIFNFLEPLSVGCFGIIASKYKSLNRLYALLKHSNTIFLITIFALLPILRQGLLLVRLPMPYIYTVAEFAFVSLFISISVILISKVNSLVSHKNGSWLKIK